jgi:DNA replication protein DnaC
MNLNNESLEKMRQMRLNGMYEAFKSNLESSIKESLTPDQLVAYLVNNEWDNRRNASIARLIKQAAFRYQASIEALDYTVKRGLDKNQIHRLASLDFIKEKKDLFITGSTGR